MDLVGESPPDVRWPFLDEQPVLADCRAVLRLALVGLCTVKTVLGGSILPDFKTALPAEASHAGAFFLKNTSALGA